MPSIKSKLVRIGKNYFPRSLLSLIRRIRQNWSANRTIYSRFTADSTRFTRAAVLYSNTCFTVELAERASQTTLEAFITVEYHRLEKSLASSPWRPGAAIEAYQRLLNAVEFYLHQYPPTQDCLFGLAVADRYVAANQSHLSADLVDRLRRLQAKVDLPYPDRDYGTVAVTRDQFLRFSGDDAIDFISSRKSVRGYEPTVIPDETIRSIIATAATTPSVCNRQPWRVAVVNSQPQLTAALELQNGNATFRSEVHNLFVVMVDQSYFLSINERNQCWVEGGLFSMNLLLSLKAHGLASCSLNWCATQAADDGLRALLNIPSEYVIIMMIAFGTPQQEFHCPASPRRQIDSFIHPVPGCAHASGANAQDVSTNKLPN